MAEPGGRAINTWPENERPREKLLESGAGALGPAELLAVFIRTGDSASGTTALDIGRTLWEMFEQDWSRLVEARPSELTKIPGIGPAKAATIGAALEIARRVRLQPLPKKATIGDAKYIWSHFRDLIGTAKREYFHVVMLDAKNRLIRQERISEGTLTESLVHPREAFRAAVRESAAAVIFVHNHPSGDPTPSSEDLKLTEKLIDASKVLSITVLDHVIVTEDDYFSFAENGSEASGLEEV